MTQKTLWRGTVVSIPPRIRLMCSFDQRSHSYLGYVLLVRGTLGENDGEFHVAIGKAAQAKHQFRAGDVVSGNSHLVTDSDTESAEFYKTSGLKLIQRSSDESTPFPPWTGVPPELTVYRERGHRRLDTRTYQTKCCKALQNNKVPNL